MRTAISGRPASRASRTSAMPWRTGHHDPRFVGNPPRVVEVVAANLEREPCIVVAAEHPVQLEVATGLGFARTMTPGSPDN